jgi:hypothetical protein
VKTETPTACVTLNCKLGKSEIALLIVIKGDCNRSAKSLLRNGSHNTVILLLLGSDRTENTVSFYCFKPLLSNALSKVCDNVG